MTHVAVLDIGKTNAKVALVDPLSMEELAVVTRPNTVLPAPPYPHFDVEGIWEFFLDSLSEMHDTHGIDRISITTHGACFVLLDREGGLACPVLDYEHGGPDDLAEAYDALRPAFAETGSARLPMGLNAGAQLHWLLETQEGLRDRVAQVASYPQYWSGRLTGHFATELTSLGCHTDLWNPCEAAFSSLPERLGVTMAPQAAAGDVAGVLTAEVAKATGLPQETRVVSGIHDSNASLYPYLRMIDGAFSVVSTGTWVVCMAVGGASVALDPARDTLMNVNALGVPTPSARFMGGREHERMKGETAEPSPDDINRVLTRGLCLLPAIETGSGPFPGREGGWSHPDMTAGEKGAALAFYLALMTGECLSLIGAEGPTIVEGPFAQNALFLAMLGVATGRKVQTSGTRTGTSIGAALLAMPEAHMESRLKDVAAWPDLDMLGCYARTWRKMVSAAPVMARTA